MHRVARSRTALSLVVVTIFSFARPSIAAEPKSPAAAPQVEQVIVVFKTHFDIGYTQLAREVVERYRTSMIDKALAVCDASQTLPPENRFVWTLSGWPMTQILWPGQTPERRTRIEKAIREGRLVWHALAGTTHTESLGLEDLVRSLGFSSRLARQFGQPLPRDAKMTDVPCHTWVVPTVLRRAGVDFLHLGCNSASGSPEVPAITETEKDPAKILTVRARVADEIIALSQSPALLVETEPAENASLVEGPIAVEVRGITEPGATVRVNGSRVAVESDGNFVARTGAQIRIEAEHGGKKQTALRSFKVRR
jgi:uncharacterized protein (DUF427 family)